jgi:hypothetical protein
MTDEPNVLDRARVAQLIGVRPDTITIYMQQSRPGGRYEKTPFPAPDPDLSIGGSKVWRASRRDEILAWAHARPRHGIGGRPRSEG